MANMMKNLVVFVAFASWLALHVDALDCGAGLATTYENNRVVMNLTDSLENIAEDDGFTVGPLAVQGLINMTMTFKNLTISGFESIGTGKCTYEDEGTTMELIIPELTFAAAQYTLTGSLVDSIPLTGDGEALFIVKDLVITFTAGVEKWEVNENSTVIQFSDYVMDMDLDRLSITMTNLMEGTDEGYLIEEFLMMNAPDIFTIMGEALSGRAVILKILNNQYPEGGPATLIPRPTTDSATDSSTDSATDDPTDSATDGPTDSATDGPTDTATDTPSNAWLGDMSGLDLGNQEGLNEFGETKEIRDILTALSLSLQHK